MQFYKQWFVHGARCNRLKSSWRTLQSKYRGKPPINKGRESMWPKQFSILHSCTGQRQNPIQYATGHDVRFWCGDVLLYLPKISAVLPKVHLQVYHRMYRQTFGYQCVSVPCSCSLRIHSQRYHSTRSRSIMSFDHKSHYTMLIWRKILDHVKLPYWHNIYIYIYLYRVVVLLCWHSVSVHVSRMSRHVSIHVL